MKNKLNIILLFFVLTFSIVFFMACTSASAPTESQLQTPNTTPTLAAANLSSEQTPPSAIPPAAAQATPIKVNPSSAPIAKSESNEIQAKPDVVIADFNQMKTGMTYADVIKILGVQGEKSGDYKTENGSMQLYKWSGKSSNGDWILSARFDNGKLTEKSQFGLK